MKSEEHRSFYIETYGCQMNFAESHVLDQSFLEQGFRAALNPEDADIVILNTCSVRKTAENRIWGRIGFYKHLKQTKELKLIITGCMAERLGEELIRREPTVDHVIGTNDKTDLMHLLQVDTAESDEYHFAASYYKPGEISSFVPIMNGCDNFCAYCIVPYVRGREVSRPEEDILKEIHCLADKQVEEVMLLGQNVNSYRYGTDEKSVLFPELLKHCAQADITWLRFMSAHPKDFSEPLIELIASEKKIANHIHLPLQSGSTRILERMNRKYRAEDYLRIVKSLKAAVPGITFTTDIMVGFPGEEEEDVQQTLRIMEEVGYIDAYMYYYNPREGTSSIAMDGQVPDAEKLSRLQRVIDLQKRLTLEHKKRQIGKTVSVLCDSISKKDEHEFTGHTEHNERVVFPKIPSVSIGDMVEVTITELVGSTYKGVL